MQISRELYFLLLSQFLTIKSGNPVSTSPRLKSVPAWNVVFVHQITSRLGASLSPTYFLYRQHNSLQTLIVGSFPLCLHHATFKSLCSEWFSHYKQYWHLNDTRLKAWGSYQSPGLWISEHSFLTTLGSAVIQQTLWRNPGWGMLSGL